MARSALLTAGLLALGACSGDSAQAPSPLPADVIPTIAEPPPNQPATTTSSTTTTVPATTSTTPAADATTTAPPSTTPPSTIDPVVVAEIDALGAEAFVDYEATWMLIRAAFEDPSNATIREQLAAAYSEHVGGGLFDALDERVESGFISLPPGDGLQRVVLLRSIGAAEVFAVFQTCETLSAPIVDVTTRDPTYEGVDSYLKEVQMIKEGDIWLIFRTDTVEQFEGPTCDS